MDGGCDVGVGCLVKGEGEGRPSNMTADIVESRVTERMRVTWKADIARGDRLWGYWHANVPLLGLDQAS